MNEDFIKIAAFLKRNLTKMKYLKREVLLDWLKFHAMRAHVAYVKENGKILSCVVARPFDASKMGKATTMERQYTVHEDSEVLLIERLVCKDRRASPFLLSAMRARFPKVKRICFHRPKRGGMYKEYDFDRFNQIANYGRI